MVWVLFAVWLAEEVMLVELGIAELLPAVGNVITGADEDEPEPVDDAWPLLLLLGIDVIPDLQQEVNAGTICDTVNKLTLRR